MVGGCVDVGWKNPQMVVLESTICGHKKDGGSRNKSRNKYQSNPHTIPPLLDHMCFPSSSIVESRNKSQSLMKPPFLMAIPCLYFP